MKEKEKLIIKIVISLVLFITSAFMIWKRVVLYLYKDTIEITKEEEEKKAKQEIIKPEPNKNEKIELNHNSINIETKTIANLQPSPGQLQSEHKTYKIKIIYHNKKAKKVKLNGSFFGWKERDMKKEGEEWIAELILKEPGEYKYYFIVDGKKILDPKARKTKDNNYSIVEVK